jgi:hypothetical protein
MQIHKFLALLKKSGGFEKYWRLTERKADLENNGASQEKGGLGKYWRLTEK